VFPAGVESCHLPPHLIEIRHLPQHNRDDSMCSLLVMFVKAFFSEFFFVTRFDSGPWTLPCCLVLQPVAREGVWPLMEKELHYPLSRKCCSQTAHLKSWTPDVFECQTDRCNNIIDGLFGWW
jgi:hypothetical protein